MKKVNAEYIPPTSEGIGALVKAGGKAALLRLNPMQIIMEYFEYKKKVEEEVAKREEIKAKKDVAIAAITAQKEMIEKYFELRFSERREGLDNFFVLLDTAIKNNSDKQIELALAGILGILKDNPLKDFESFRESFQKENYQLEI